MKPPPLTSRREHGQAVLLVVVAMGLLLFGALGLALDGGQMYAHRQMAQTAADAAAQAGIMSIFTGTNATTHTFGTGSSPPSSICTTTDLRTPCVYARNNGFGGTAADTVTLSFPATVSGVTLFAATVPAITVTVQRTLKTGLIRMIPGAPATSSITAKSTAALVGAVSQDCIYVLDPSAASAFDASNGVTVAANGCAIVVNSSSPSAVSIVGGATVSSSAFLVVGGSAINNGGSATPSPVAGSPLVTDPFASLPKPTPVSCDAAHTNYNASNNASIQPGTYCNGLTVSNGVTGVTFASGIFIINGGALTFGGGTTSSGSGVMFYLTGGASLTAANGVTVTFSAPTTAPYMGVLFFQDKLDTSTADFAGGATMQLTGSLYFPGALLSFSNGVSSSSNTAIIAKQVKFTGGAKLNYDPTGLKTGLFSKSVVLVQ